MVSREDLTLGRIFGFLRNFKEKTRFWGSRNNLLGTFPNFEGEGAE